MDYVHTKLLLSILYIIPKNPKRGVLKLEINEVRCIDKKTVIERVIRNFLTKARTMTTQTSTLIDDRVIINSGLLVVGLLGLLNRFHGADMATVKIKTGIVRVELDTPTDVVG